jgi:hypothetical protein
MERNDNLGNVGGASSAGQGGTTGGASGTGGTAGGTGGYGGTSGVGGGTSDVGGGAGGFGASGGGSGGAMSGGSSTGGDAGGATGLGDRAKDVAGSAQERLSDVGSTVRDRAGQAKNNLADVLEAGAQRLRGRGGQQLAGATASGEVSVSGDGGRVAEIGDRVAGGLQTSADWLREADIDGLRDGVERQVRENPGRTLLIAVGLGYLLGKAFRR